MRQARALLPLTSQIVAWVHYLPASRSLAELRNLHAYFLAPRIGGSSPVDAHVAELQRVAEAGRDWRKTHGRPEDADAYVYRLALEWSRLWSRQDEEA